MRPITISVGPLAGASANNIAASQTPTSSLTLNGSAVVNGIAVLDNPRRVLFTTTDSTHTATIVGTNWSGNSAMEVVAMNGTAAASTLDYHTITSITANGTFTAPVTVGTNGVAASPWVRMDDYAPGPVSIQCNVFGTVNYTIQQTLDDPNSPTNAVLPAAVTWLNTSDAAGVGASGSIQSNYAFSPVFARVLLNSGTGIVVATFLQSGAVPY